MQPPCSSFKSLYWGGGGGAQSLNHGQSSSASAPQAKLVLQHEAGRQSSSEPSLGKANINLVWRQRRASSEKFGSFPRPQRAQHRFWQAEIQLHLPILLPQQDLLCCLGSEGLNIALRSSWSLAHGYLLPEVSLQLSSHAALSKPLPPGYVCVLVCHRDSIRPKMAVPSLLI